MLALFNGNFAHAYWGCIACAGSYPNVLQQEKLIQIIVFGCFQSRVQQELNLILHPVAENWHQIHKDMMGTNHFNNDCYVEMAFL